MRYDLPVIWQPDPANAALLVEARTYWFSREVLKAADAFTKSKSIVVIARPIPQQPTLSLPSLRVSFLS